MKYLLMLVMIAHGAVSAAELRHYDVLVYWIIGNRRYYWGFPGVFLVRVFKH